MEPPTRITLVATIVLAVATRVLAQIEKQRELAMARKRRRRRLRRKLELGQELVKTSLGPQHRPSAGGGSDAGP